MEVPLAAWEERRSRRSGRDLTSLGCGFDVGPETVGPGQCGNEWRCTLPELRWNPLLGTWTMVAPNRQERPVDVAPTGRYSDAAAEPGSVGTQPASADSAGIEAEAGETPRQPGCPFCPGSGKVPSNYTVLSYDNDYPALTDSCGGMPVQVGGPYKTAPAYGKCEVILYSPDHDAVLWRLPDDHVRKLVDLWVERCCALSRDPLIKYVFIFENRGAEVGVTLHHPHGQLYAYPFVPLKITTELDNCRRYFDERGRCLLCDMNLEESREGPRLIAENEDFLCYLPSFTDYPFGAFIVARRHVAMLHDLRPQERSSLASMLKGLVEAFDHLFARPFPYMMCVHQGPVNEPEYEDAGDYYHLHIEFYPPLRAKDRLKYYASSEMGAWAACNPLSVEETAPLLRDVFNRVRKGGV